MCSHQKSNDPSSIPRIHIKAGCGSPRLQSQWPTEIGGETGELLWELMGQLAWSLGHRPLNPASELKRRGGRGQLGMLRVLACQVLGPIFSPQKKSERNTIVKLGTAMCTCTLSRQMKQEDYDGWPAFLQSQLPTLPSSRWPHLHLLPIC